MESIFFKYSEFTPTDSGMELYFNLVFSVMIISSKGKHWHTFTGNFPFAAIPPKSNCAVKSFVKSQSLYETVIASNFNASFNDNIEYGLPKRQRIAFCCSGIRFMIFNFFSDIL